MAAIVTAICKSVPAGAFVVCPFLLRCGLLCPTWAPAGAAYPPLPAVAGVSALETGQRALRTHGGKILQGGGLAHNAQRAHGQDTAAPCGGASPVRCGISRAGEARKAACGRLMAHTVNPPSFARLRACAGAQWA